MWSNRYSNVVQKFPKKFVWTSISLCDHQRCREREKHCSNENTDLSFAAGPRTLIIYEWMELRRRSLEEDRLRIWEVWKDGGTTRRSRPGASSSSAASCSTRPSCWLFSCDQDCAPSPTGKRTLDLSEKNHCSIHRVQNSRSHSCVSLSARSVSWLPAEMLIILCPARWQSHT